MSILDYVKDGSYIALFTNIDEDPALKNKLKIITKGKGYSGNWVIGKKRLVGNNIIVGNKRVCEKILLYVRENNINRLYKADYINRELVVDKSRDKYRIHFDNIQELGKIAKNWKEFSGSQASRKYYD